MKAALVEEMKVGGIELPLYSPILGAVFESPSYKDKVSKLKIELF